MLLLKHKYIRRWRGPDGKWRYEYPSSSKGKGSGKKTGGSKTKKKGVEEEDQKGSQSGVRISGEIETHLPEEDVYARFEVFGHTLAITRAVDIQLSSGNQKAVISTQNWQVVEPTSGKKINPIEPYTSDPEKLKNQAEKYLKKEVGKETFKDVVGNLGKMGGSDKTVEPTHGPTDAEIGDADNFLPGFSSYFSDYLDVDNPVTESLEFDGGYAKAIRAYYSGEGSERDVRRELKYNILSDPVSAHRINDAIESEFSSLLDSYGVGDPAIAVEDFVDEFQDEFVGGGLWDFENMSLGSAIDKEKLEDHLRTYLDSNYEPDSEEEEESTGKDYSYTDPAGVEWNAEELQILGEWVAGGTAVKAVRSRVRAFVDGTEKDTGQFMMGEATGEQMFENNSVVHENVTRVYRGTKNTNWENVSVGDHIPFGIGSFSKNKSKASDFGNILIECHSPDGLRGVDIDAMIDDNWDGLDGWGIAAHSEEKEFVPRARYLRVTDVSNVPPGGVRVVVEPADDIQKADRTIVEVVGETFDYRMGEEPDEYEPPRVLYFGKAKGYAEGTVRTWKDGIKRKKIGKEWVPVGGEQKRLSNVDKRLQREYERALDAPNYMGPVVQSTLEDRWGIFSYEDLKEQIADNTSDYAGEIAQSIMQDVQSAIKEDQLPPKQARELLSATVGPMNQVLKKLRSYYSKPKKKLMVQVPEGTTGSKVGRSGQEYEYKNPDGPPLKVSTYLEAQERLGGWDLSGVPDDQQLADMMDQGQATLVRGTPDPDQEWEFRTDREKYVEVPFRENEEGIDVSLVQKGYTDRSGGKRKKVTAEIKMEIPYAYALGFIQNKVEGKKMRNSLTSQLLRSSGYQRFLRDNNVDPENYASQWNRVLNREVV